jgi:hypothetical protein
VRTGPPKTERDMAEATSSVLGAPAETASTTWPKKGRLAIEGPFEDIEPATATAASDVEGVSDSLTDVTDKSPE